jgi:hypothetical protein
MWSVVPDQGVSRLVGNGACRSMLAATRARLATIGGLSVCCFVFFAGAAAMVRRATWVKHLVHTSASCGGD